MFLKTFDEKQKFNLKNLNWILKIGWHSDLHGKNYLNISMIILFNNVDSFHVTPVMSRLVFFLIKNNFYSTLLKKGENSGSVSRTPKVMFEFTDPSLRGEVNRWTGMGQKRLLVCCFYLFLLLQCIAPNRKSV